MRRIESDSKKEGVSNALVVRGTAAGMVVDRPLCTGRERPRFPTGEKLILEGGDPSQSAVETPPHFLMQ